MQKIWDWLEKERRRGKKKKKLKREWLLICALINKCSFEPFMCFIWDFFFFFKSKTRTTANLCHNKSVFFWTFYMFGSGIDLTWKKRKGFVSLLPGRSWEVVMLHRFSETWFLCFVCSAFSCAHKNYIKGTQPSRFATKSMNRWTVTGPPFWSFSKQSQMPEAEAMMSAVWAQPNIYQGSETEASHSKIATLKFCQSLKLKMARPSCLVFAPPPPLNY